MSEFDIEQVNETDHLSDRELMEAIYLSQRRVELLVEKTLSEVGPMLEKLGPTIESFQRSGIFGLFGR